MKKISLAFYCITLMLICQPLLNCVALTKTEESAVSANCTSIKDSLRTIQQNDSRTRVYFGSYYETILTKFITPLNVRLIENNLSSANLVENQNNFAASKNVFSEDFIKYQQSLEELISIDCKSEPTKFYEKLSLARDRRKIMEQDVLKMRNLLSEHVKLVNGLKGKL